MTALIDHKVVSEHLKLELSVTRIQELPNRLNRYFYGAMDLLYGLIIIKILLRHHFFKLRKGQLVSLGKGTIVVRIFLNCVICQMSECIVLIVLNAVFHWTQTNITLLEDIALYIMRNKHPDSNIEFSVHYKQGFLKILLD